LYRSLQLPLSASTHPHKQAQTQKVSFLKDAKVRSLFCFMIFRDAPVFKLIIFIPFFENAGDEKEREKPKELQINSY
jgi:hypothetical protein